jgi:hypothetical protein
MVLNSGEEIWTRLAESEPLRVRRIKVKSLSKRTLLAAAMAVAAALPAAAQVTTSATNRCTSQLILDAASGAEVYTLRVQGSNVNSYSDWGFDVRNKGGMRTQTLADVVGRTVTRPANDREFASGGGSDIEYVIITLPPQAAGEATRMMIDSGRADNAVMGAGTWHYVGAGMGWTATPTLPSARGTRAAAGGGFNGGELQFGMFAEVNTMTLATGCFIGGAETRPGAPAGRVPGLIVGYNVFRIPGAIGTVPAPADFMANGSWQYYIDVTQFDNDADAGGLTMPQRPATAASDNLPDDLAGLQNPSVASFYDGNERLFFQDTPFLPNGMARTFQGGASAAVVDQGYWYAVQPVVSQGTLVNATAYNPQGFTNNASTTFFGNHVISIATTGGGTWEGIDLDLDGTPEFLNPQVAAGIQGLGLTNRSQPLLSTPVFADLSTAALPAGTQVVMTAEQTGSRVNIEFSMGLTAGDVRGFNVYRLGGDARDIVNKELIPAQSGEGSVYSVVDDAIGTVRRVRRDATFQYELEIVYDDGSTRTFGPFDVVTPGRETGRRTR